LQHPSGLMASALCNQVNSLDSSEVAEVDGPLGPVVHSIRGSISNFQIHTPTTSRFTNCTACSQKVLDEFSQGGFELLLKTSQNPKYLEEITGISDLMSDVQLDDVIECFTDDED